MPPVPLTPETKADFVRRIQTLKVDSPRKFGSMSTEQRDVRAIGQVDALQVLLSNAVLLVGEQLSDALYLSARNLHWVGMAEVDALDPALLISFDKVLVTQGAMNQIEERLQ